MTCQTATAWKSRRFRVDAVVEDGYEDEDNEDNEDEDDEDEDDEDGDNEDEDNDNHDTKKVRERLQAATLILSPLDVSEHLRTPGGLRS